MELTKTQLEALKVLPRSSEVRSAEEEIYAALSYRGLCKMTTSAVLNGKAYIHYIITPAGVAALEATR